MWQYSAGRWLNAFQPSMVPALLTIVSWIFLAGAFASAAWLIVEQVRRPQQMWIMNVVWPITALYMGPIAIWAYYTMGRQAARGAGMRGEQPFWQTAYVGTTHCGSGCTLGDVLAEFAVFFTGFTIVRSMFASELILDFAAAYLLGIVFQYFAIAPMRGRWGSDAVWAAIKADTLSLITFEIGLFAWMAIFQFVLFPGVTPDTAAYWFMMQIGMCLGFLTSYPMNWWLIKSGVKEAM
jgi:hypothetical protein